MGGVQRQASGPAEGDAAGSEKTAGRSGGGDQQPRRLEPRLRSARACARPARFMAEKYTFQSVNLG